MRCVLSVSVWLCGGLELDVTDNSGTDSGGRAGDRYWGYIYIYIYVASQELSPPAIAIGSLPIAIGSEQPNS